MIKLSILIPSIPERLQQLTALLAKYESYLTKYSLSDSVELLCIVDNKKRSIGKKRSDLIAMAQGEFVAMSDDDDEFTEIYFQEIGEKLSLNVDVITYWQYARINQEHTFVEFGLKLLVQDFNHKGVTKRPAWHCCTWKRDVVKDIQFADISWGEDHKFQEEANLKAQTEWHIPEICHIYNHDSHLTASFQ